MTERKVIWNGRVQSDMVDYNGHMNDASYSLVFSESLDALMERLGWMHLDESATHTRFSR
ncbi:thioesterase family protein [Geomicrobium sp. JCM 19037]|uniref:thioesterase family protein n=1 Tax=Geomicrobium sp. JCM 19037 TaxID=1460634 RepID=UPI0026A7F5B7